MSSNNIMIKLISILVIISGILFVSPVGDVNAIIAFLFYYPIFRWLINKNSDSEDRMYLLKIFHFSLLVRTAWVIIGYYAVIDYGYHINNNDPVRYHAIAIDFANYASGYSDTWLANPKVLRALFFHAYLGVIFTLFDKSVLSVLIGNAYLSSVAIVFVYTAAKRIFNQEIGHYTSILMLLFLPSIVYDVYFLKESMVMFLVSLTLLRVIEFQYNKSLINSLWMVIVLVMLYYTRIYYAFFFIPAIGWLMIYRTSLKEKLLSIAIFTGTLFIIIQEMTLEYSVSSFVFSQYEWFDGLNIRGEDATGIRSMLGIFYNPIFMFNSLLNGFKMIFILPIFFYIEGFSIEGYLEINKVAWSLFSTVMWFLMIALAWGIFRCLRYKWRETFVILSTLGVAFLFFSLKSYINFRYKMGLYPILFIFASFGWTLRKQWGGFSSFYLLAVLLVTLIALDIKTNIIGIVNLMR